MSHQECIDRPVCGDVLPGSEPKYDFICHLPMGHDGAHRGDTRIGGGRRRWELAPQDEGL